MGTARINRSLIPPLRQSSRNHLAAVASRTPERARAYAEQWAIPRAFGSYDAMLADASIDVVYISLPNALHAGWTIRAVEAGKHVLCEKPLAITVDEVDAIAAAAAANGRVVSEAFMYRHHPQTAMVERLVRDGAIGELRVIRGVFTFVNRRDDDARWDPALGGGSLWDVGCYPVSYARVVTGSEPVRVQGWSRLTAGGVDETFAGLLEFPGGVVATFDSSFRSPFHTQVDVAGTRGRIRVATPFKPGQESAIEVIDADGSRTVAVDGQELYSGEVEDLASAILDGTPPRVTLADSRANVAALVALHESARLGSPAVPRLS